MLSCACALPVKSGATKVAATAMPEMRSLRFIAFLLFSFSCPRPRREPFGIPACAGLAAITARCAKCAPSIGEGPHPQFRFRDLPEPRQAVRFHDQEEDDQRTNDHEFQMLDGGR